MHPFQLTQQQILLILSTFLVLVGTSLFAQGPPVTQLGVMQTADTLGKGGYTTSVGMFQVSRRKLDAAPKQPQRVIIGNFEGLHNVEFDINTFLIPAQLTYGIGERLDLLLGATFSTGGAHKIVPDFYRIGDTYDAEESVDSTQDRRVYEQSIFELVVGLKRTNRTVCPVYRLAVTYRLDLLRMINLTLRKSLLMLRLRIAFHLWASTPT